MEKKVYILFGIRTAIGVTLVAAAIFLLDFSDRMAYTVLGLSCGGAFLIALSVLLCFLSIKNNKDYYVIKSILSFLLLNVSIIAAVFSVYGWFLFGAGVWCIFFMFSSRALSDKSVILLILKFFGILFNIGYKGKAPVNYFGKIIEVFLQLSLLFVSIFIQILCIPYGIFYGHYAAGFITQRLIFCKLKQEKREKGFSYNVGASNKTVNKKVTNNIRDNNGNVIGTYDSTVSEVVYDDGERYDFGDQFEKARAISFAALPLRLLSMVLSIFALLIPHLYISVRKPNTEYEYNYSAFRYCDIIVFKKQDRTTIKNNSF